jgi:hypothetical protein
MKPRANALERVLPLDLMRGLHEAPGTEGRRRP